MLPLHLPMANIWQALLGPALYPPLNHIIKMNSRKLKLELMPFARYLMRIFSFICILHLSSNTKKENFNNNVERRVASIDYNLIVVNNC